MEESDIERIRTDGHSILEIYRSFNIEMGYPMYHMLRKAHQFIHLLDDLAIDKLNPRFYTAWLDETFMRWVTGMCRNKVEATLPQAVLRGWLAMVGERWLSKF